MRRDATAVRQLALDTIDSTNAEALRRARAGESGPLWITAEMQSAGRGRRGREWMSALGNLHATLLLIDPSPAVCAPQLSFVAALALHDAVAQCTPLGPVLALKWPNDLLLGEAKLAGILIEGENDAAFAVVIGIGVNCTHHPENSAFPATDLAAAGALVTPQTLFSALAVTMERRLAQWASGEGFAAIRADWLKRAAGLDQTIQVRLPQRELTGIFEGLDEEGRLLVRQADAIMPVTAGEVFGFSSLIRPLKGEGRPIEDGAGWGHAPLVAEEWTATRPLPSLPREPGRATEGGDLPVAGGRKGSGQQ
jgi:BirA family biotin operon repressor/biotin-[acetyl-CoA-carboxylase] ligase